ncbi:DUF6777 domain-containing protein [Streptomyces sp. NPDC006458]|uniref:DUF6777 domain-containing protein n=1 Tax=Streptomyces sp. NPDC006458 TaxID=3154302 RepID=UPI0033AD016F
MRSPIRTLVTAIALLAALVVAGCAGADTEPGRAAGGEVFLQPVAAQGPDPFTDSTADPTAKPAPVTPTPRGSEALARPRLVSGATAGLYGGAEGVGSCDVRRQIGHLTADPAKARAFADVEGIGAQAVPGYLRGLTPVQLRADTRVTNHGWREGRTTVFQSVLQSGTAVLVDTRGVPRVRCACGNPLLPPTGTSGPESTTGTAWSGYRPAEVVVVTPAPKVITHITIIDIVHRTWIERRCGQDARHDRPVAPPAWVTRPPSPSEPDSPSASSSAPGTGTPSTGTSTPRPWPPGRPSPDTSSPDTSSPSAPDQDPRDQNSASPDASEPGRSPADCFVTPTVTVTTGATRPAAPPTATGCPTATVTATPRSTRPPSAPGTGTSPGAGTVGPQTVPDTPDLPDGGGLVPDDRAAPRATGIVFGSPLGVFDG